MFSICSCLITILVVFVPLFLAQNGWFMDCWSTFGILTLEKWIETMIYMRNHLFALWAWACSKMSWSLNLFLIFLTEQPYDSIPNFSAADALRLTGIGRNEFIDIMNKCRSKVTSLWISWIILGNLCLIVYLFLFFFWMGLPFSFWNGKKLLYIDKNAKRHLYRYINVDVGAFK